jgi:putative spermidine/putrescine transport system substrate-binding protein
MKLRRRILVPLGLGLILLVGALFFFTRPPPILNVMTWPGPYGRAQANAQMHPFAARNNVDVRMAVWDGDLADVRAMVAKQQYKADVIDFELPKAAQACKEGLIEKIDPAILPDGANGMTARRDFVSGALGPCWVGSVVYSQVMIASPRLRHDPQTLADFFDTRKFPGRRALSRASAKYNLEMALLADGVAPKDVYATLATQEGLTRAFAKLQALNPIWAHDSIGALRWVKDGQAVMATVLNGDIAAEKDFTPHVIWDHQLYELDVFGIPAGDPARRRAQEYIAYATGSEALAGMARWVAYGPARRSAFALVKPNPETGADLRPLLPTNPDNFHQAFAINERWWLDHGADIAPRWQEFVSR